jgi:hypothetical protein
MGSLSIVISWGRWLWAEVSANEGFTLATAALDSLIEE